MDKKVFLLGATGRTGKVLLRQMLDRRYDINVLVRDPKSIATHQNLSVFEGTPTNETVLKEAMEDCEAVVSTLNISRKSDFPWSKLTTPDDFLSQTIENVIRLGCEFSIKRVIVLSAWGVGDSKSEIPWWFKWLINNSNIGAAYRDHERQENLLIKSGIDYTIVRPVGLTNSKKEKKVSVSLGKSSKPGLTISRHNVARFIISSLEHDLYVNQIPVIYT